MPEDATAKTRSDAALLIDLLPEPIDLEVAHELGQL
jgi:hypothetical protein